MKYHGVADKSNSIRYADATVTPLTAVIIIYVSFDHCNSDGMTIEIKTLVIRIPLKLETISGYY